MSLNPHTREDSKVNQLMFKLILISLGLHITLFLVFSYPPKKIEAPLKSISVELAQTPKSIQSGKATPSKAQRPNKQRPTLKNQRDVFPKIPKQPSPETTEEREPLRNWEEADLPLIRDLAVQKNKVTNTLQKSTPIPPQAPLQESRVPTPAKVELKSNTSGSPALIEGDVQGREIIYQPITPPLDLAQDVTITLQFSVTADGRVTNIYPIIKGDQMLEQIAIKLLSRYRFEPAPQGTPDQIGIIHFNLTRQP